MDVSTSDIDLNVYGEKEGKAVYRILSDIREELEWVSAYDSEKITPILHSRWGGTGLNLDHFRDIDVKKFLHGTVQDRDYFIRLLKPVVKDEASKPLGTVKIRGMIKEADSIFTPCTYMIRVSEYIDPSSGPDVSELVSFRGRFTEQVEAGTVVEVTGTLEEVSRNGRLDYRIILGGPGDYLLPAEILDR